MGPTSLFQNTGFPTVSKRQGIHFTLNLTQTPPPHGRLKWGALMEGVGPGVSRGSRNRFSGQPPCQRWARASAPNKVGACFSPPWTTLGKALPAVGLSPLPPVEWGPLSSFLQLLELAPGPPISDRGHLVTSPACDR